MAPPASAPESLPGSRAPRRRPRPGLTLLAAALLLAWIVHVRTPDEIPPPSADGVRVVTYNIRAGLDGLDHVAEDLRALRPDLVALQEVERGIARSRSEDQAGHLGAALDLHSAFAGSFEVDGGEHGIAILSRWPILRSEILELPRGAGRWSRVALIAHVETPHGVVCFTCIHLARPWGWPFSNTTTRLQQIDALRERLRHEDAPRLVAGDFNSFPVSLEGWALTRDLDHAWSPWRDGWGLSFPLKAIGLVGAVKIDHILHGPRWSSRGTWVAPQGASDHRAVVADLTLPK